MTPSNDDEIDLLFRVPSVSHFDLDISKASPKRNRVLFSSNKTGRWQIYLGSFVSSAASMNEEIQVTNGDEAKIYTRFSPDGKSMLYMSDCKGDENFDIFLRDLSSDDKSERNVTPGTEYAIIPDASFSSDGRKIALVSNKSGKFAAQVLELKNSEIVPVAAHDFSDTLAIFSPDDRMVAYTSLTNGQNQALFVKSLLDQEERRLTSSKGEEIDASDPSWSPDGRSIAFVSSSRGSYDIGIWEDPLRANRIRWLTDSTAESYEPSFSHDGKKVVYCVNTQGDIRLVIHDLTKNKKTFIDMTHGVASSPKFTKDDRAIVFLFASPRSPQDLWTYKIREHRTVQLTKNLPRGLKTRAFVDGKHVIFPCKRRNNSKDQVPALLFLPRGRKPENLPAVISIHGGPTAQALNSWDPFEQLLISHGIAVLKPNYRGSTGYGRKYRESNRFVMGDLDLADCVSGKDFLVEEGFADPNRVAVTGGSFGGYLTMCALTAYPEEWACGSALVPFLNWFTEIENEREDLRYWDMQNMGNPKIDKERLRKASPIFFIDKIKAPVQLIGGAHDPRCPLEEVIQARDALQSLGREVDYKAYEDEGHGFRKTENRVDAARRRISFIEKYLFV